eukprot:15333761-Ditylum_brightwellii.AAC.1
MVQYQNMNFTPETHLKQKTFYQECYSPLTVKISSTISSGNSKDGTLDFIMQSEGIVQGCPSSNVLSNLTLSKMLLELLTSINNCLITHPTNNPQDDGTTDPIAFG